MPYEEYKQESQDCSFLTSNDYISTSHGVTPFVIGQHKCCLLVAGVNKSPVSLNVIAQEKLCGVPYCCVEVTVRLCNGGILGFA